MSIIRYTLKIVWTWIAISWTWSYSTKRCPNWANTFRKNFWKKISNKKTFARAATPIPTGISHRAWIRGRTRIWPRQGRFASTNIDWCIWSVRTTNSGIKHWGLKISKFFFNFSKKILQKKTCVQINPLGQESESAELHWTCEPVVGWTKPATFKLNVKVKPHYRIEPLGQGKK